MQLPISISAFLWLLALLHFTATAQPNRPNRDTLSREMISSRIDSVVVSSTRPAIQWQGNNMVIGVSNNPLFATAANTWDILRKIPGLDVTAEGGLLLSGRITPGVFINGKPMPMSTEELLHYLAGLTPGMIASIEIITNPSGKYEGEYKAIIDIRLKQDLSMGWKGNISTQVQHNAYTLADNNLNISYKTHLWTYTARLGYTTGSRIRRYEALQHLANTNILSTHTETRTGSNNFSYALGAAYDISQGHQLEVQWRTYLLSNNSQAFNTLSTTDSSGHKQVSHSNTLNQFHPRQDNYTASVNYTATLGKSQLVLLTNYSAITNAQQEDIQTRNTLTSQLLSYWKTNLQNQIRLRSVQADWSANAGKGKISAGARYAHTTTRNDLQYDTLTTNAVFVNDSGRTNSFHYNEYIAAAYLVYQNNINRFSYTASLRAEQTYSKANAITQKQVTNRSYTTWLPSLTLTYKINELSQYNLSYTRRITRPGFAQLNPFRFYNSPLNYFVGNPLLLPSTTQTVTFTYNRKAFSASLHAGKETAPMSRYPEYNPETNELEYLGRNLPYNDFAGIEVTLPLTLFPWWKTSHTLGGYYKKEQTPYHGVTYAIGINSYTINANHVFTLPHSFTLDVYFKYLSRGGNGLYLSKALSSLDLGVQKSLFKGQLNMKVNYYDVFNAYRIYYIFREKQIINNELQHWLGFQRLAFSLTYSFGKSTHKARQQAKTEEENRAGL